MTLDNPALPLLNQHENVEEVRKFFNQWALYQKIVDHNYLGHKEAYSTFGEFLREHFARSFSLIDLGSGDASFMARILQGMKISSYEAVDISPVALSLASKNMCSVEGEKIFTNDDFFRLIQKKRRPADVIWIGLSLHHLPFDQKSHLISQCRRSLTSEGLLMIYDPVLKEGESRDQFVQRWWAFCQSQWMALSFEEKNSIYEHVRSADFPETLSTYKNLGKTCGFSHVSSVFVDCSGIYEIIVFKK